MKYLKLFEKLDYSDVERAKNPSTPELLSGISPEFWKMCIKSKWGSTIINCKSDQSNNKEEKDKAAGRVYTNYSFQEVRKFNDEFNILYKKLYEYFKPYWLGEVSGFKGGFGVSDDGYWDLLSSIIGKGKVWTIKCIRNPKLPVLMVINDEYLENFQYILNVGENEYYRIQNWYMEILFNDDLKKYNL